MGVMLKLPARCPPISKAEWREYVSLAREVEEAEAILAAMKADLETKRKAIWERLELGGSIEDGGQLY